jgi:hypothetical protein
MKADMDKPGGPVKMQIPIQRMGEEGPVFPTGSISVYREPQGYRVS